MLGIIINQVVISNNLNKGFFGVKAKASPSRYSQNQDLGKLIKTHPIKPMSNSNIDSEYRAYPYIQSTLKDLGWDVRNPARGGGLHPERTPQRY